MSISNHLHRYFHVIGTATARLHRRLARAEAERRTLQITDELTSYTVDVISALAFGHDLNTLEREEVELQRHIQRVLEMAARRLAMPFAYWRWIKLPADRALQRSVIEFRPERWLGYGEHDGAPKSLAFGAGPSFAQGATSLSWRRRPPWR